MALNPIIEAFLAAREQASRDFAQDQQRVLAREQLSEEAKRQQEQLKNQRDLLNIRLSQEQTIADAQQKLHKLEIDRAARTGDAQTMMKFAEGVSGGSIRPPTKTSTQQTLNPDFMQVGQPTTFDTTKTELDEDALVAALGPLLSDPNQARAAAKLLPPFGNEAMQKMDIAESQQRAIGARRADEMETQFGFNSQLQDERLRSAEGIAKANREAANARNAATNAARLQGFRMKAASKSADNVDAMKQLADTEHMQFFLGKANQDSLTKFTSLKDRAKFVQFLKDAKTTVVTPSQTKAYEGLDTLVQAYDKYKAYADAIEKSGKANMFGTATASFDPEVISRQKEADSVLEIVGRGELQAKGVITDKDADRLTGARPDPLPAGKWSIGQSKQTIATNRQRLADFQYHIVNKLNQNTAGFSNEQRDAIMENAGLRYKDLLPEVVERLNKGGGK